MVKRKIAKQPRSRRPRRRVRRRNPLMRTTNELQMNAMRPPRPPPLSARNMPFLMCRKFPFDAKPSNGIPDGDQVKKIVIDHRQYSTIKVGTSGTFAIKIMPWMPYPFLVKASDATGFTIDGVALTTTAIFSVPGQWQPLKAFPELTAYIAASGGKNADIQNPYSCAKFRIVTIAARLVYTGAPTLATGTVTIYDDPIAYNESRTVNELPVSVAGSAAYATGTVLIARADLSTPQSSLSAQTYVARTDIPVMIRPKHLGSEYCWIVTTNEKTFLVDSTITGGNYSSNVGGFTAPENGGLLGWDPKWVPTTVFVEGATPDTTFRIEYIICLEYQPAITDPTYRLAKTSVDDLIQLTITNSLIKEQPTANPDVGSGAGAGSGTSSNTGNAGRR